MTAKQKPQSKKDTAKSLPNEPWIPMRNGVIIISITSVGMAVLTAAQVIPSQGWGEGLLWGLLFGGLIWVIFFGYLFLNRFLRR